MRILANMEQLGSFIMLKIRDERYNLTKWPGIYIVTRKCLELTHLFYYILNLTWIHVGVL